MRKTSTYARKQRLLSGTYNGAEAFNTIQRCRAYTTEPIIGMQVEGTQTAATRAMIQVRQAYDAMLTGNATEQDFDKLAHALGVSMLRAIEIAGEDDFENPMLPILKTASDAARRAQDRYKRVHRWGFDGPAIDEVLAGVELYETILQASSPTQMTAAAQRREAILEVQGAMQ